MLMYTTDYECTVGFLYGFTHATCVQLPQRTCGRFCENSCAGIVGTLYALRTKLATKEFTKFLRTFVRSLIKRPPGQ